MERLGLRLSLRNGEKIEEGNAGMYRTACFTSSRCLVRVELILKVKVELIKSGKQLLLSRNEDDDHHQRNWKGDYWLSSTMFIVKVTKKRGWNISQLSGDCIFATAFWTEASAFSILSSHSLLLCLEILFNFRDGATHAFLHPLLFRFKFPIKFSKYFMDCVLNWECGNASWIAPLRHGMHSRPCLQPSPELRNVKFFTQINSFQMNLRHGSLVLAQYSLAMCFCHS